MSRQVSLQALQDMLAQEAQQTYVETVTIIHQDLPSPLRFVNDSQDLTIGTDVYQAFPFSVTLPTDDEDAVPKAQLQIFIVDLQVIQAIRSISTPPDIELQVVAKETKVIELGPIKMKTVTFSSDEKTATFTMTVNRNLLDDAFPKSTFNPSNTTSNV